MPQPEQLFRRTALGMEGAIEGAHMGHPDFRAHGRIFATLRGDRVWGMVVLTPEQQEEFVRAHPAAFVLESGAWGRSGCTKVKLDAVDEDTLGEAMTLAWQNAAAKSANRAKATKPPKAARPVKTAKIAKTAKTGRRK